MERASAVQTVGEATSETSAETKMPSLIGSTSSTCGYMVVTWWLHDGYMVVT